MNMVQELLGQLSVVTANEIAECIGTVRLDVGESAVADLCAAVDRGVRKVLLPTIVLEASLERLRRWDVLDLGSGADGPDGGCVPADPPFSSDERLCTLVRLRHELMLRHVRTMLQRLSSHISELRGAYPAPLSRVTGIELSEGETHNGGQGIVIITFDHDARIVYKPVSLSTVVLFSRIVERFITCRAIDIATARVLYGTDRYGFLAFVRHDPAELSPCQVERFYRRVGAVLAVAYGLLLTDMHLENMIVAGEHPVLLDLEAMLYHFPPASGPVSVRSTGMIGPGRMTAIQAGGRVWEWGIEERHLGHDIPIIGYRHERWFDTNRVYCAGGFADPCDHVEGIVAGFRLAYDRLVAGLEGIYDMVASESRRLPMAIRHILRYTSYYNLLLAWQTQPSLGDEESFDIMGRLRDDPSTSLTASAGVIDAEWRDLRSGDVPYFWSFADGVDLLHATGVVHPGYFPCSALQRWRSHLRDLCDDDRERQVAEIRSYLVHEGPQTPINRYPTG